MSAVAQSLDVDAAMECGAAITQVLDSIGVVAPVEMVMLVEDPGAANFAAGLLPVMAPLGRLTIYTKGHGAAQLARLDVKSLPLNEPFDAGALLARNKPGLVLVGTSEDPNAAAHDLVRVCRAAGVPTLGFVDGPANIERRFRGTGQDPLSFAPDVMLVPAARLRARLIETGIAAERVSVVTHPHFAHLAGARQKLEAIGRADLRERLFPMAGRDRRILVFLAERSGGLDATEFRRSTEYTLAGRGGDDRRTNVVLEEVLDALNVFDPRPYVVLRLHPKNDSSEFSAYVNEIDQFSHDEPALDVVYAADAVVGLTSILLSEAAMLGRPVLSVVPRAVEQEWLLDPPQIKITRASQRTALIPALRNMIR